MTETLRRATPADVPYLARLLQDPDVAPFLAAVEGSAAAALEYQPRQIAMKPKWHASASRASASRASVMM